MSLKDDLIILSVVAVGGFLAYEYITHPADVNYYTTPSESNSLLQKTYENPFVELVQGLRAYFEGNLFGLIL
jgi:hypothetical protein